VENVLLEIEKGKSLSCLLRNPRDCSLPGSTVHGILQARILEWVAILFSRALPNPGIEPRSPTLQADSLPSEPSGKPKNSGVGSLSLLQQIFPTQELNQGGGRRIWDGEHMYTCGGLIYTIDTMHKT